MIQYTPKKFIDMVELNGYTMYNIIKGGADRSYFLPRYKDGNKTYETLEYSYKKGITEKAIEKIALVLIELKIAKNEEKVKYCFIYDNFETLLPEDLL